MPLPHEGNISLKHSFDEVWAFVREKNEVKLETERKGTPFEVEDHITSKGVHLNKPEIVFYRNGSVRATSYPCCWGHYYNCNRTRIGMYCSALDNFIP